MTAVFTVDSVPGTLPRYVKTDRGIEPFVGDTVALQDRATALVSVWRKQNTPAMLEVSPIDPSGDAAVTYRYYFDDQGRARHIDVRGATFHSGCTDVLRIHRRLMLGLKGDSIGGELTLTDRENKPVTSTTCEVSDAFSAPRYATYADAVKAGMAP